MLIRIDLGYHSTEDSRGDRYLETCRHSVTSNRHSLVWFGVPPDDTLSGPAFDTKQKFKAIPIIARNKDFGLRKVEMNEQQRKLANKFPSQEIYLVLPKDNNNIPPIVTTGLPDSRD